VLASFPAIASAAADGEHCSPSPLTFCVRQVAGRPRLVNFDRLLFVWLYRFARPCGCCRDHPTGDVIRLASTRIQAFWRWKSRSRVGRPTVSPEIRELIREMSPAQLLVGRTRIHGELLKLGIEIAQSTVAKYMTSVPEDLAKVWATFAAQPRGRDWRGGPLRRATIGFQVALWLGYLVTAGAADSLCGGRAIDCRLDAQQIVEAFPWDQAPQYFVRSDDASTVGDVNDSAVASIGSAPVLRRAMRVV